VPNDTFEAAMQYFGSVVRGRVVQAGQADGIIRMHAPERLRLPAASARDTAPERERGAALVEFVLIVPLALLVIFGGITAALAYEHKADVVHAVRDGARYGATVPLAQCDVTSNCGSRNWAELVQFVTAQRSDGALNAAQICVALVAGPSGAVFTRAGGVYGTGTTSTFPATGCFNDGNADAGMRVHVSAVRGGDRINLILTTLPVTLSSNGAARYEQQ
jgi:Flp pilus assembly protein TadG